ncbi:hypothetical protein AAES_22705 [Amazona aestiva]|uniref:Vps72/YL1 C-terminal domain-containing protein n=1 Tax=Amazona aestiva TaxID=12930 RepID=A0A0Q3TZL1_AMAAE|nr:hypothetical protein AAES_22705 [Amazona aestiva]
MTSYRQELEKYRDIDEDKILRELSAEELEQLDTELMEMDPENVLLPAGLRQRDQTHKSPTGPLDREALLQHLEKQALEAAERQDLVPFTGEKKGKPFVPKNPTREIPREEQITLEPELEEALAHATEAEMCDIAETAHNPGLSRVPSPRLDQDPQQTEAAPAQAPAGKCSRTFISFSDDETFERFFPKAKAPRLPVRELCPVTHKPAVYRDPITDIPYSNIRAFKIIREAYKKYITAHGLPSAAAASAALGAAAAPGPDPGPRPTRQKIVIKQSVPMS